MQTKSDRAGDEKAPAGDQKPQQGGSDPQSSTPPASPHQTDPLTASEAAGPITAHGESSFEQRFRGLNELARGGQGRVLVGRDVVLEREVAVKELLRANHPAAIRRFEREARLTARLQHPGIVSIYELARRSTGEPALVMRRVQGVPLDKALTQAGSYAKRLAYLPAVTAACDAIAYAHRQGVLHRDIKASNVLVGEFGETVVIDWGIAKELASSDPESTDPASPEANPELTAPGEVVGTPASMSPEQARGEAADVQSDVYALGALLYQLIAGRPAYEGKNSLEVLQQVRKGPPPALTSVVPEVAPELASMVSRAMAPEKSKRTGTAAELAEELKSFQTGRLVSSHAYSSMDLLVRWARRNKLVLSVTAVFVVVLAAVATVSVRRILAERERANREAATARRVSGFMTDMFKLSDPGVSRGNSVTVREVLDKSAKDLKSGLSEDPEVRARLLESMGTVYSNLGLYPEAQGPLDEAEATLMKDLGPDDPEVLNASLQRVIVMRRMSKFDEAEKAATEVIARATRVLGPSSEITLEALSQLGVAQRRLKKPKESEATLAPALALARAKFGNDAELTLQLMNNLAVAEGALQKFPEEEKLLTEAIATRKRVNGPDAPFTLGAMNNLGGLYHSLHRDVEAAQVFQEVWEADKRVLGPDHPDTIATLTNTAALLFMNSKYKEVEPLVREVVAARERRMGPENAETLDALNNLSAVLLRLAKWDEAEAVITRARAGWLKTKGPDDSDLAISTSRLAFLNAARGRKAEALQLMKEALPHLENKIDALEDPLLEPLHGDPQYEAMLKEAKAAKPAQGH